MIFLSKVASLQIKGAVAIICQLFLSLINHILAVVLASLKIEIISIFSNALTNVPAVQVIHC